eukprot:GSChrysophyteH1.ASY1.ANO1.1048.1 assembled CDS
MYCTGGIRCEKASAYLKAKGVGNVYQLQGGIHRYLEEYPSGSSPSLFVGKNYVFDCRTQAMGGCFDDQVDAIVGKCVYCTSPRDTYNGHIACSVCRLPVLVCVACSELNTFKEFHCEAHQHLKDIYFAVLDVFSDDCLIEQREKLEVLHSSLLIPEARANTTKKDRRRRRTLRNQIKRITDKLESRKNGLSRQLDHAENPQVAYWIKHRGKYLAPELRD